MNLTPEPIDKNAMTTTESEDSCPRCGWFDIRDDEDGRYCPECCYEID